MSVFVPYRLTAKKARIFIAISIPGKYYTPVPVAALYAEPWAFGPAADITIEDPIETHDFTGAGDPGRHNPPVRRGVWKVSVGAFWDVSGQIHLTVPGDARFGSLNGKMVEFLVTADPDVNYHIVKGVGLIQGRLQMPAAQGASIMRDMQITRVYPDRRFGNLNWADEATGKITDNGPAWDPQGDPNLLPPIPPLIPPPPGT